MIYFTASGMVGFEYLLVILSQNLQIQHSIPSAYLSSF